MVKLTTRKREKLPKTKFACPKTRAYPIDKPARVSSAKAYYQRENTAKCKGGKQKICNAAKKFGLLKGNSKSSHAWKQWCRI
jgi:hypothetical protein